MSIYAISDLHLSFNTDKPMNIFGDNWKNHEKKIQENWIRTIKNEDTVLLSGDFSWGMTFQEVKPDFEYLNKLPGRKIMLKGNHDYWWGTLNKIKAFFKSNNFNDIDILYNNSYLVEDKIICGTRGWTISANDAENEKIYKRELLRLEISLKDGINKYGESKEIIVCMHYPPTNDTLLENSEFIQIMKKYNVKKCVYGHLHGEAHKEAIEGYIDGIEIKLVSCDYIEFKLISL
ncbi:MAG: serine/threonine protein phosphatase [Clostridia bacterium]|nr:serine/threonine protein phosphatase [Clostridia bacterium]